MRTMLDRRLIGLNIALLGALAVVTLVARAGAQPGGNTGGAPVGRGRGEYTMVAGKSQGVTTSIVYIVDAANQEIAALNWDRTNNRFDPVGLRVLPDDSRMLNKPR